MKLRDLPAKDVCIGIKISNGQNIGIVSKIRKSPYNVGEVHIKVIWNDDNRETIWLPHDLYVTEIVEIPNMKDCFVISKRLEHAD